MGVFFLLILDTLFWYWPDTLARLPLVAGTRLDPCEPSRDLGGRLEVGCAELQALVALRNLSRVSSLGSDALTTPPCGKWSSKAFLQSGAGVPRLTCTLDRG